jgi:hypothetical protein
MSALVIALGMSFLAAVILTLWGLAFGVSYRKAVAATPSSKLVVQLQGQGELNLEPGVLLNTLWEHLPNADCQAGECGGCQVRLLEGQVRWIREPLATIDRSTHVLACSCEPVGSIRCSVES